MTAPVPENEAARLAALRDLGILDSPPELAYDDLTALAAYICHTPIALVSLIDADRQWFKSRVGWTAQETPREVAFCAHAILEPDLFIVPDATADERFATNPLVTSPPSIRFYAAAPLMTAEGQTLGTLCVIDHKPRQLIPEQARALRALGRQVLAQLRLAKQLTELSHSNAALTRANEALQAEVAQRRRAEQALREAEQRLALAMRVSRQGPWEIDLAARRVKLSGKILALPDDCLTFDLEEFERRVHPEDAAARAAALDAVLAGRSALYRAEYRLRNRAGRWTWVYSCGQVVEHDAAGRPARLIGMALDVTERKETEEALRQSAHALREQRNQLTGLLDHLPLMVFGVDADNRYCLWNKECERVLGFSREEVLGRTRREMYPHWYPDPEYREWVFGQATSHAYRDLETNIVTRDGTTRICSWSNLSNQVRLPGLTVWGNGIDVTERKRVEQALRESEERFRGTFESAGIGIAHSDFRGHWLRLNAKLCAILGYPRDELLNKTFRDITHPDDLPASLEHLDQLVRREVDGYTLEKRYLRKDGSVVWVDLSISVQRDAAGDPCYLIAVVQDISERKRLEVELRQAKEAAEAASRAKSEFLTHVSHEVRTPLNAILGMNELALDTPVTEQQRRYLTVVQSSAQGLLEVIDDLLDFSKIEAGKLELEETPFSLRGVLDDTLPGLAVLARRKGLELARRLDPEMPDYLVGDAGRLRQILTNLVGNAIKFTEEGEVVVEVNGFTAEGAASGEKKEINQGNASPDPDFSSSKPSTPSAVNLFFSVRDTGIGIPTEKQQKIFEAFEQADSSTTRRFGGTGLGLSIASRLVGLMGGRIEVASAPGRGSTFSFTVRLRRAAAFLPDRAVEAVDGPGPGRPLRVLLAEDNPFNQAVLEDLLPRRGHSVVVAGDGRATLAALAQDHFDALLLDIHMPELDGFQVIATLRQREQHTGRHLPVIALTARSAAGERARCLEAGMDDYLAKPVRAAELFAAIDRVVGREEGKGRRDEGRGNGPGSSLNFLPSSLSLFDPDALLAACDENAELLWKMCRHFRRFVPERLAEIHQALDDRDGRRLREATHKLGGMVSSFSASAAEAVALVGRLGSDGKTEDALLMHGRLKKVVEKLIALFDTLSIEQLRRWRENGQGT
jgi:PAS domain S-box-containing protein